ncbi:MAG: hypothetical protein PVI97_10765 [Candidatus Thiodiazotropha sp.]|jgi:hypothetical protein
MKLSIEDIETLVFVPEDGSHPTAIKVVHRPSKTEVECNSEQTQAKNRHSAIVDLVATLTENKEVVKAPKFVPFDQVKVLAPNTEREGKIREIIWHFKSEEWSYYIESDGNKVSKRYVESDLANAT